MGWSDNQHRLVCRRCGRTEEVGCAIGDQHCLSPARVTELAVDEAEVVFWGLCPVCKAVEAPPDRGLRDAAEGRDSTRQRGDAG